MHISQCDAQLILPNAPAKELRRYVQGEYIYVPLKLGKRMQQPCDHSRRVRFLQVQIFLKLSYFYDL